MRKSGRRHRVSHSSNQCNLDLHQSSICCASKWLPQAAQPLFAAGSGAGRAGAKPLHVPFTGAGPMGQAALGGQIHAFVESPSIPVATGLPVLAVFGARRLPSLPEAPTTAELGHPVEGTSAGGLVAPAGIPEAAFARLQSACEKAVGGEAFRTAAARLNAVPSFLPGDAFRARFAAESEANRELLRALDLARD